MTYILDPFFTKDTMSIHTKQWLPLHRKKWKPWAWKTEIVDDVWSQDFFFKLIQQLQEETENKSDCFLEIEREYHKVYQNWPYRIVVVFPPLSDGIEITAVRPVARLSFEDYNLDDKTKKLLTETAKWILIAGAPWSWKTTFVQALVDVYVANKKVVKTIESPRDLQVPNEVVQYSFSYWTHNDIRDILLLSRPDYTAYDEVRNADDFVLFKDLRLTWIWLLWVIHGSKPVDAIQRFVWTIEIWVIPQVIDTVVYIDKWEISEILQLSLAVKVPHGMKSDDLSRPVIEVRSFFEDKLVYEIYSYGEQIVVIPIDKVEEKKKWTSTLHLFAKAKVEEYLSKKLDTDFVVKVNSENSITIYVPVGKKGGVIGRAGDKIVKIEKDLWSSISVRTYDEMDVISVNVDVEMKKKQFFLKFPADYCGKEVHLLIHNWIFIFKVNNSWVIRVSQKWLIKKIQQYGFVVVEL